MANLRIFFFQQANDIRGILFYTRGSLMRLEFFERRFSFADADRELMAMSAMIDDASGDYENSGLVGDDGGDRINLEEMIRVLSSE